MQLRHFLAAVTTLVATPGLAQAEPRQNAVVVRYADLDLSSPAGVARLDRRILSAVQAACGATSSADPKGANQAAACRSDALAQLQAKRGRILAAAQPAQPDRLAARQ
jgi:UrcA family protein